MCFEISIEAGMERIFPPEDDIDGVAVDVDVGGRNLVVEKG